MGHATAPVSRPLPAVDTGARDSRGWRHEGPFIDGKQRPSLLAPLFAPARIRTPFLASACLRPLPAAGRGCGGAGGRVLSVSARGAAVMKGRTDEASIRASGGADLATCRETRYVTRLDMSGDSTCQETRYVSRGADRLVRGLVRQGCACSFSEDPGSPRLLSVQAPAYPHLAGSGFTPSQGALLVCPSPSLLYYSWAAKTAGPVTGRGIR